jgi:hypothetical protein
MAKETIFVDTSAWYATVDKSDQDHRAAVAKIQNLSHPLVTSNYIFDETLTLLKTRLGPAIAAQFGKTLWNQEIATLIRINENDEDRAWKLFLLALSAERASKAGVSR